MTEAQKQPQSQQAAPAAARPPVTPDAVESALAILGEVAKHFATPANPAPQTAPLPQPAQAQPAPAVGTFGEYAGRLEELTTTLTASPVVRESRLRSSRLWTMIGTVATLVSQHPLGFELSPVTQVCIVGVTAIYIAARSLKGETTGA
ncbi:hypothetical protein [Solidesulfovibrio sp.]|uniref:hypothetical protein n=1 Tax=Solidesulfovibrio sp. TaxID=2910990 RepID=UPI002609FDD7|nr:hypothetical protein [Solidesulfovibrio sp.]